MPGGRVALAALLAACFPVTAPAASRAGTPSPAALVRTFYTFHFAHDMAFTRSAVRRRAAWLSPELLAACRAYFARPEPADEPAAIDGDAFTNSQEYPRRFRVGAAVASGDTARVSVAFTFSGGDRRAVTVVLTRARRAWRIADIQYDSTTSLLKLLAAEPGGR